MQSQQTTFEYLHRSSFDAMMSDITESDSRQVYISIYSNAFQLDSLTNSTIIHLNEFGDRIKQKLLFIEDRDFVGNNLFTLDNGHLSIIGSYSQKANQFMNAGIALISLDSGFVQTALLTYNFPINRKLRGIHTTKQADGRYITGGGLIYEEITPPFRPIIYEFGPEYDSLKAKYFLVPNEGGHLKYMRSLDTNIYWGINYLFDRYHLFDKNLNLIETQNWKAGFGANSSCKWDTDTSFYLLGQRVSSNNYYDLGVIRQYHPMDTTGSKHFTWHPSDTIDFPALWAGIDLKHRDTVYLGGTRNLSFDNPYFGMQPSWFIIVQTDSALNVRWERFYGGDAYYVMTNVLAAKDGGCFVGGSRYDYINISELKRDVILLKLSKEGLIVGGNELASPSLSEAIVYPNPGSDMLQIRVAFQHPISLVTLFDLGGKMVLLQHINGREAVINTTGLGAGTYIYVITAQTGLHETGKWVKQ